MSTIALIILLASLLLAAGSAYWFLQWKCPTIKEKVIQLVEAQGEEAEEFNELSESSPAKLKEGKKKLAEEITKAKKLKSKKSEELEEAEQESLDKLPTLEEIQTLVQKVEKKEDLDKKVYGYWDYVYAAGIALIVFGLSWGIGNFFAKKLKGESG